jgi:drug/metabolite transporter (DMT)-like permease
MVLSSLLFALSGLLVKLLAEDTVPTFLTVAVRSAVVALCTWTVQHHR